MITVHDLTKRYGLFTAVDHVSLSAEPGRVTGFLGPNGSGKSNISDAIRWVMGEQSTRTLRGGKMEDVIFAGTSLRPGRNLAEVSLFLEDAEGLAPPPHADAPELEIVRRIARGEGSAARAGSLKPFSSTRRSASTSRGSTVKRRLGTTRLSAACTTASSRSGASR